jgi:hypothetical protein
MREAKRAWGIIALIVGANVLDLGATYLYTPDLRHEANVLVVAFGLGWGSMILGKVFISAVAGAGYLYYLRHRRALYPEPGRTFPDFAEHFLLAGPDIHPEGPLLRRWLVLAGFLVAVSSTLLFTWLGLQNLCYAGGFPPPLASLEESLVTGTVAFLSLLVVCYRDYAVTRNA